MSRPRPTDIRLNQRSKVLEIAFDDGDTYTMSCEYLRVHSPSAEVQGHGPGREVLQVGKEGVNINRIEPVGNYAVRLHFDDGHHTGIYSWDILHDLGKNRERYWQGYLDRLEKAGYQRSGETNE